MTPEEATQEVSSLIAGLLAGKVVFGFAMVAKLVPAIQNIKGDTWLTQGLSKWAGEDPEACTKLAKIFQGVGNAAPIPFKGALLAWIKTDPNALMLILGAIQQLEQNTDIEPQDSHDDITEKNRDHA